MHIVFVYVWYASVFRLPSHKNCTYTLAHTTSKYRLRFAHHKMHMPKPATFHCIQFWKKPILVWWCYCTITAMRRKITYDSNNKTANATSVMMNEWNGAVKIEISSCALNLHQKRVNTYVLRMKRSCCFFFDEHTDNNHNNRNAKYMYNAWVRKIPRKWT